MLFLDSAIAGEFLAGYNLARAQVEGTKELMVSNIRSGSVLPHLYVGAIDK